MRNFRVILRSSLEGTDMRLIVEARDAKQAERLARSKVAAGRGYRCVRVQAVN